MERIVRIVQQSPLATRQYMDRKTGDQKVINTITLKMTDGNDTFLGEITGERAVNCPQYDPTRLYQVQCSMVVREWNSQQTGEQMQATTIYIDKINLMWDWDRVILKTEYQINIINDIRVFRNNGKYEWGENWLSQKVAEVF